MGRVVTDRSADEILQLIGDFFMKRDDVHDTMYRVVQRLKDANIPYALAGGMALGLHGYVRVTGDVDILTTREGLEAVHQQLIGRGFLPAFTGARKRLRDTQNNIPVDFIATGEYPGDGKPKDVRFPDPATASVDINGIQVVTLEKLIELKLASGLSNPDRLRDLADVQDLIAHLDLPLDLADKLDPSVRDTYIKYWHGHQNATGPDRE
ncbi:MAG: hypothetical protein DMF56_03575 [Acidobacteria bacterium]|nr:MAG: hypothetical protein DMF56_03575 [Acidobacteriota bacterium]